MDAICFGVPDEIVVFPESASTAGPDAAMSKLASIKIDIFTFLNFFMSVVSFDK